MNRRDLLAELWAKESGITIAVATEQLKEWEAICPAPVNLDEDIPEQNLEAMRKFYQNGWAAMMRDIHMTLNANLN